MFTGIIKAKGQVQDNVQQGGLLMVRSPIFAEIRPALGASIAIDGVCLTVSRIVPEDFFVLGFALGPETQKVTLLGEKKACDLVNIEPAVRAGEPMDGHLVQGHVDGLGEIVQSEAQEENILMRIRFAKELRHLIVKKGSIAVNGVSLTINEVADNSFCVCLIPHTVEHTCFSHNHKGDRVHLETDIMGRYLLSLLQENHFSTTKTIGELHP